MRVALMADDNGATTRSLSQLIWVGTLHMSNTAIASSVRLEGMHAPWGALKYCSLYLKARICDGL